MSKPVVTDEMVEAAISACPLNYYARNGIGQQVVRCSVNSDDARSMLEAALSASPRGWPDPHTYPAEFDVLPHMEALRDRLDPRDSHMLGSAMLEILELRKLLTSPPAPGWADPLESDIANRLRSREIDDTDILDLFDQMEREIRVHRKTFCEEQSRTHTPGAETERMREAATRLIESELSEKVRALVAGWNGEGVPEEYRMGRHDDELGVTLPTNCGSIYMLDEVISAFRAALGRKP